MNLDEALKFLNIEEFYKDIYHSSSTGELFHLYDYIVIAERLERIAIREGIDPMEHGKWFGWFFRMIVDWAKENWNRPQSIYQHMITMLEDYLEYLEPSATE